MLTLSLPGLRHAARFVVGGALNTAVCYVLYLGLSRLLPYQLAYFLAYALSIGFSYWFNSVFVFRTAMSWQGLFTFPGVYLIQYLASAALLGVMVETLAMPTWFAPLLVSAIMLPLTYVMTKVVLTKFSLSAKVARPSMNISSSTSNTQQSSPWHGLLQYVVPSLIAVAAIWLPFGFSMLGNIEEWGLLGLFNIHGWLPVIWSDGPLAAHAVRPLMPFTFAMANLIAPDSFWGFHVLQMVALLLKGGAVAFLVARTTGSRRWAVLAGPLVILFPADTMQISFRSLHINWALALVLLGCVLLTLAVEQARTLRKYALATAAALMVLSAACMYEAALTLVPVPLLLIYVRSGLKALVRFVREQWRLLGIWLSGAIVYMTYMAWISAKIATYQGSIAGGGHSTLKVLLDSLPKLFSVGLLRSLAGGWYDALAMVRTDFASYSYLLIAALLIAAAIYFAPAAAAPPNDKPAAAGRAARLIATGLLLCMLGYTPFLLLPTHQVISQRTFIWASPGAALVWIGGMILLARWRAAPAALLAFVLLTAGLGAQLVQHHQYQRISETQRKLLKAIVENFDGKLNGKTLLILDGSNSLGQTWVFPDGSLGDVLAYFYGHYVGSVETCRSAGTEWQRADQIARKGSCLHDDTGWTLRYAETVSGPDGVPFKQLPDVRLADDATVVIKIDENFAGSNPGAPDTATRPQLNDDSLTARRYHGVLEAQSWPQHWQLFRDQQANNAYKWQFGDWWSLEVPVRGTGWREAEWNVGKLHHNALAWKYRNTGTLEFELTPSKGTYLVRGRITSFTQEMTKSQMRVSLNGQDIAIRWGDDGYFDGVAADKVLRPGLNRIEFTSPVNPSYYGLSDQLDWFEVKPK